MARNKLTLTRTKSRRPAEVSEKVKAGGETAVLLTALEAILTGGTVDWRMAALAAAMLLVQYLRREKEVVAEAPEEDNPSDELEADDLPEPDRGARIVVFDQAA